jgi:hypothetical protein
MMDLSKDEWDISPVRQDYWYAITKLLNAVAQGQSLANGFRQSAGGFVGLFAGRPAPAFPDEGKHLSVHFHPDLGPPFMQGIGIQDFKSMIFSVKCNTQHLSHNSPKDNRQSGARQINLTQPDLFYGRGAVA